MPAAQGMTEKRYRVKYPRPGALEFPERWHRGADYRGLASHELTAATGSGRRGGTRDAVYMLRIAWRKPNASIGGQYTWQKKKGEEIEGYI